MSDDQFMKLFKYAEETRQEVAEIKQSMATKDGIADLRDTVVDFAGHLDDYAAEMAAMARKVDRLEKYIQVLAKKTGVDLNTIHI